MVDVKISSPKGYDEGAWRVEARLDPSEIAKIAKTPSRPVVFRLPKLESRTVVADRCYEHDPAHRLKDGSFEVRGTFKKGWFYGHCWSNGCPEKSNPTPIDDVREWLKSEMEKVLASR